ncbi:MAG: prefoldin subunit alpha [Nanoarchaeota archaeon]|nr:prefoldin subunit alpha [Nanoarchaeota archaeon]
MKEEEKQQKMIQLQILAQQAEQIRMQLGNMEEQMDNLRRLSESLEHVEKEKLDNEMFSPLSSGVYIKTNLKDNKEVLVAVGANVFVKKSISETKDLLKEQEKKMELLLNQTKKEFENFANSAMQLEKELSQSQ